MMDDDIFDELMMLDSFIYVDIWLTILTSTDYPYDHGESDFCEDI